MNFNNPNSSQFDQMNRRREWRLHIPFPIKSNCFSDNSETKIIAEITSLSTNGVSIQTRRPIFQKEEPKPQEENNKSLAVPIEKLGKISTPETDPTEQSKAQKIAQFIKSKHMEHAKKLEEEKARQLQEAKAAEEAKKLEEPTAQMVKINFYFQRENVELVGELVWDSFDKDAIYPYRYGLTLHFANKKDKTDHHIRTNRMAKVMRDQMIEYEERMLAIFKLKKSLAREQKNN